MPLGEHMQDRPRLGLRLRLEGMAEERLGAREVALVVVLRPRGIGEEGDLGRRRHRVARDERVAELRPQKMLRLVEQIGQHRALVGEPHALLERPRLIRPPLPLEVLRKPLDDPVEPLLLLRNGNLEQRLALRLRDHEIGQEIAQPIVRPIRRSQARRKLPVLVRDRRPERREIVEIAPDDRI